MTELIVTSSVLILVMTALRFLLRGRLSARLQYALWLLVAVRLLLPFPLFASPVSVMNLLPTTSTASMVTDAPVDMAAPTEPIAPPSEVAAAATDPHNSLAIVWLSGSLILGGVFLVANLRMSRRLRADRLRVELPGCKIAAYTTTRLPSPCLYGLLHPAIYLTPESMKDAARLTHILAHEQTHYRHKDHLWALLRAVCVCLHWYNPLVWLAASLSRQDSELACDEGALVLLGDENRTAYGRTLIEMMVAPASPADLFCCATTMSSNSRELVQRMRRIASKTKMLLATVMAVLLVTVVAVAATFGGSTAQGYSPDASSSITPPTAVTQASYRFTRVGKGGEVISIAALTDEKLAAEIIMDSLYKSAAWQGVDIDTLEEYYLIEQSFSESGETNDFYAYLREDGSAVLQMGKNGMYTALSQELYDKLDGIYIRAMAHTTDTLHKLSEAGGVALPATELPTYIWQTNSESMRVQLTDVSLPVKVELYDADDRSSALMTFTLDADSPSKSFTNLTAARNYLMIATGNRKATLTVSD